MRFENAIFEFAAGTLNQLPKSDLPEIVFSGRSNVGKSSLINKIVGRKSLARVSATPGKTGTINFYNIKKLRLIDLPGYGYAKVSLSEKKRWSSLVQGYFNSNRNISLVVQIVDMRHPPTQDDMSMIEYLKMNGFPFMIALTKSDKLKKNKRIERMEKLRKELSGYEGIKVLPTSSVTGEGIEDMREILLSNACD